jgi:hypothetical protein
MGTEKIENFDVMVRQVQIIVGALVGGVFFFLVIVLMMGNGFQPFDPGAIVSLVMAGLGISMIFMRLMVPSIIVSTGCQKIAAGSWGANVPQQSQLPDTDEGKLLQLFLTKVIIGSALLEGGAFGCLIAFLLEGQIYTLVLAVILVAGILMGFPTRGSVTEWLETQLRRVQEGRSMKL